MLFEKLLTVVFVFLFAAFAYAQPAETLSQTEVPAILPPSPEPFAFVRAGVGSASMSTGAATANIPLYIINLNNFSFPISLSYSTQGLKADEICSSVGLGWVLNANGVISRSVKGEPDEFSIMMDVPSTFADTYQTNDPSLLYVQKATTPGSGHDSQPDEFQFNVNGHSGKFVLAHDSQGTRVIVTSAENIKITADVTWSTTAGSTSGEINGFSLLTPDGVTYFFGGDGYYEITNDISTIKFSAYKNVTRTAFFLNKIQLPTQESLAFFYEPFVRDVTTGISETMRTNPTVLVDIVGGVGFQECGSCGTVVYGNKPLHSKEIQKVTYRTQVLKTIRTSNGLEVNFVTDADDDHYSYSSMEVVGQKKYTFHYHNAAPGRFFLQKIQDVTNPAEPSLDHEFSYHRIEDVPAPITTQQDYLGFYNASGYDFLISPWLNNDNGVDLTNRQPYANAAMLGTLSKITYPTGGTEEFFYEGNTKVKYIPRDRLTYELSGPGGGSNLTYVPMYYSQTINIPCGQEVTLTAFSEDANPNDNEVADPTHHSMSIWIYDGSQLMASRSVMGYTPTTVSFSLPAGNYLFKIKVETYAEVGYATLYYTPECPHPYDTINIAIPGVRLKQIKYFDPFTKSSHSKYYKYATLEKLYHSTGSSMETDFSVPGEFKTYCAGPARLKTWCRTLEYQSGTMHSLYSSSAGTPIYYSTVIESDDPNLANGGTEYTFYPFDNGSANQLLTGIPVAFMEAGQMPTLTGKVWKKRTFNQSKKVIRIETDTYDNLSNMQGSIPSVYVRKRYDDSVDRLLAYDVVRCDYGQTWIRLKQKTVTSYDGDVAMTDVTEYTYGSSVNVLPAAITMTDSKGDVIKIEKKYPSIVVEEPNADAELVNSAHVKLKDDNILFPVIQETIYRNNVLQQQRRTLYKKWDEYGIVLAPEKIRVKQSATDELHDVIVYNSYNGNRHPLEVKKVNDLSTAYLWDNKFDQPIAEVQNAQRSQIAYTSFETETTTTFEDGSLGNWAIVSGAINASGGLTGPSSFSGSLSAEVNATGTITYIVTVWTSSTSAPTANGVAGTKMLSAKGWDLYQWNIPITNSGTVNINGSNLDEARLLPADAQMKSYTYKPFVGPLTVNDTNNTITYYSYDEFGRLKALTDKDGNVVKTYQYHYQNQY
jgi:YD repeat-containing protein